MMAKPIIEKFTVHYDDGSSKEVATGLLFDMDQDEYTTACFTNVDAVRIVRAAVSVVAFCEETGLTNELISALQSGAAENINQNMEVIADEEHV